MYSTSCPQKEDDCEQSTEEEDEEDGPIAPAYLYCWFLGLWTTDENPTVKLQFLSFPKQKTLKKIVLFLDAVLERVEETKQDVFFPSSSSTTTPDLSPPPTKCWTYIKFALNLVKMFLEHYEASAYLQKDASAYYAHHLAAADSVPVLLADYGFMDNLLKI